jgi:hypothetical protein
VGLTPRLHALPDRSACPGRINTRGLVRRSRSKNSAHPLYVRLTFKISPCTMLKNAISGPNLTLSRSLSDVRLGCALTGESPEWIVFSI